jgi:hypothetical protein
MRAIFLNWTNYWVNGMWDEHLWKGMDEEIQIPEGFKEFK